MNTLESIRTLFEQRFQTRPTLFHAPGRINLIGEHTDYNQGWVLPAAIDRGLWFAVAPNQSDQCHVIAADIDQEAIIPLPNPVPEKRMWVNYLAGIAHTLELNEQQGFDCVFGGNLPVGAGLSSSAAMECGLAFALNRLFSLGLEPKELAQLAQRSSNSFVGVPCGIMDQFASLMGKPEMAILLDCRNLDYEYIPARFEDHTLLLVDSGVHHELAESAYGERVRECATGIELLSSVYPEVTHLRDVSPAMLEAQRALFDAVTYQRCHYVVLENERVHQACRLLKAGDMEAIGALLQQTHAGLREEYSVSCSELDFLADFANQYPGVAGARMMGGGFGGCTLNLLEKSVLPAFGEAILKAYRTTFGIEATILEVNIDSGVRSVNS